MKYTKLSLLMLSTALLATPEVNTLTEVFSEAKTSGNIKYYYIQTDKDHESAADTSAYANSLGGQLSFDSASLYGFSGGVTFMTTNPFLLGPNVDTSIIGKDNGARGYDAQKGFSVLGEAYLTYNYSDLGATIGRKVIKTPLVHAKEVRMLPSAVEGIFTEYRINKKSKVEIAYLDKFKQRTSDTFVDMYEHALAGDVERVTGKKSGSVVMVGVDYSHEIFNIKAYDYYADDFMNTHYIEGTYKLNISDVKLSMSGQYLSQKSIGNAEKNLLNDISIAGGDISVNAFGLKLTSEFSSAKFCIAYSNVLRDDGNHDSVVSPWDGTPLFTNMITSNDLFQSIYGQALQSDSIYIGGAQGIKFGYKQKFDSLGLEGFSTALSYLHTTFDRVDADKDQNDYNIVLAYKANKAFALALKGIWVENNTAADAQGNVTQLKLLSQYRVIANYKF